MGKERYPHSFEELFHRVQKAEASAFGKVKLMAKKKSRRTVRKSPKKLIRKRAPRRKKGGRGPSGKKKASKVHKILKWLRLRK
jgi:hypothetical protein